MYQEDVSKDLSCLVPSLVMGMMEIRVWYYIVRVTVIEIAPYMEQDGVRIQTDPYKLESETGKMWIKVTEDYVQNTLPKSGTQLHKYKIGTTNCEKNRRKQTKTTTANT